MKKTFAIGNLLSEYPGTTVIGVSKTKPADLIEKLYEEGLHDFGENYVQEFLLKYAQLKHLPIRWHFVGSLQSNKVKYIIDKIECLHSLSLMSVAEEIQKQATKHGRVLKVLLQINLGGETSKSGLTIEAAPAFLEQVRAFDRVKVIGLMTIPPMSEDPERTRPYFRQLRELRDGLKLTELSMGMSDDYQIALEEGATMVRLGTLLFGTR